MTILLTKRGGKALAINDQKLVLKTGTYLNSGRQLPLFKLYPILTSINDTSLSLSYVESGGKPLTRTLFYTTAGNNTYMPAPNGSYVTATSAYLSGLNPTTSYDIQIQAYDGVSTVSSFYHNATTLAIGAYAPLTDLLFNQTFALPPTCQFANIGRLVPVGGIGPYKYSCLQNNIYFDGTNGYVRLYGLNNPSAPFTFTVVDGAGASKTISVVLKISTDTSPVLFVTYGSNVSANSNQSWYVQAYGGNHNQDSDIYQITSDPTHSFSLYGTGGTLYTYPNSNLPAGNYPLTLSATSATVPSDVITLTTSLLIDPVIAPPTIHFTLTNTANTESIVGSIVGQALATTQNNINTGQQNDLNPWRLSGPDSQYFFINLDGTLRLNLNPKPTAGIKHITLKIIDNLASTTRDFTFNIPQGTVLPATNISLTIPQNLNNGVFGQIIGTPQVVGMNTANVLWSVKNNYDVSGLSGTNNSIFLMDPTTGYLICPSYLAARVEGHDVYITATDGINVCTRLFNIPSVWIPNSLVLYVGAGMNALHGNGVGYDHFSDLIQLLGSGGGPLTPNLRGATVVWAANSDPDYYANDNANGAGLFPQNYGARFGIPGPIKFIWADPTGARVRVGGAINSASGGGDMGGKGFFVMGYTGDFYMEGFEVSFCNGPGSPDTDASHGISGVRVNGNRVGDFTAINCSFHDCNNGVESGISPAKVTIHNCIAFNNGGQTVSSGQTHAFYLGGAFLDFQNNVSFNNNIGHCLKSRCYGGIIKNNVLADGEGGSSSQCLNIPNGGNYLVTQNVLHKGPNQQNPAALGYHEDIYGLDRINTLTLTNNIFSIMGAEGNRNGTPTAVFHFPAYSSLDGSPSTVLADGNSFYLHGTAVKFNDQFDPNYHPVDVPHPWVETNSITLTVPPVLNLSDPGTANPPVGKPGFYNNLYYYGDDIINMNGVQIKSDVLDIRFAANTVSGTVLTTLRPYGAELYANDNVPNDIRINPFRGPGNIWSITQDSEFYPTTNTWAPIGYFNIVPASDGLTANITMGTGVLPGTYLLKIRIVSSAGTIADWRYYLVAL